jgi:hypothetical protein
MFRKCPETFLKHPEMSRKRPENVQKMSKKCSENVQKNVHFFKKWTLNIGYSMG